MNSPCIKRFFLFSLVFVFSGLVGWVSPAQANIDDFIKVYEKIESAAPPGTLPVSSGEIKTYKSLFQCIAGGDDIIVCTYKFKQTEAGKKATADIPEAVWKVIEAYIAWKAGDTWGVVKHLGAAAMCAVLQVIAGGFDACGLIKDLVELGESFLDAGKEVAKFFKDLGEGTWKVAKGIYCGIVGCDDGPPPKPKAQIIYEKFFAPKVLPDGLIAIKAKDPFAFNNLKTQLGDQAKAQGYSKDDILKASLIYTKAVDAQWTSDMVQSVLKQLSAERDKFNTPGSISLAAKYSWDHYNQEWDKYHKGGGWPSWQSYPNITVPRYCKERFENLGFGHVDRWIDTHNEAKQLNVLSNYQWCENVFYKGNLAKFGQEFKERVETRCPGLGCPSNADEALCDNFLKPFGLGCVIPVMALKEQPTPKIGGKFDGPFIAGEPKKETLPIIVTKPGQPQSLPDITSAAQIVIGSMAVQWGATVNVDAKQAFSSQNGVCQFVIQYTASNIGLIPTGSFDSIWKNSNAPGSWNRTWGSIASGGQDTQKDMVTLKPGTNILNLTLDHTGKVQESNENNNQFRVIVNLTGSCGQVPGIVPQPQGERKPTQPQRR